MFPKKKNLFYFIHRNIDCANDYANESEIGDTLQKLFSEGVVKREDLFIQAKLWNSNHRKEDVQPDLEVTLRDLKLDYVDSFVVHWPQAVPADGFRQKRRNKKS